MLRLMLYSTYNYIRTLFSGIYDQIILTRWILDQKKPDSKRGVFDVGGLLISYALLTNVTHRLPKNVGIYWSGPEERGTVTGSD